MTKAKAKLDEWTISTTPHGMVARGYITEDERGRFNDGTYVHTSLIVSVDVPNKTIETLNTIYQLT